MSKVIYTEKKQYKIKPTKDKGVLIKQNTETNFQKGLDQSMASLVWKIVVSSRLLNVSSKSGFLLGFPKHKNTTR